MEALLPIWPSWIPLPPFVRPDYIPPSTNPTLALSSEHQPDLPPNTHTHPIEIGIPFIARYARYIREELISIMGNTPWVAIDVLRRGTSEIAEECPITIILTVYENETGSRVMKKAIDQVKIVLRERCSPDINLEVREGDLYRYGESTENMIHAPNLGDGIGCGTLGGYVTVTLPGYLYPKKEGVVLTTGRIVQEPGENLAESSIFDYGKEPRRLLTRCFAGLPRVMPTNNEWYRNNWNRPGCIVKSPFFSDEPRRLGRILATSNDYKDPSGRIIDWVLIEVNPVRRGNNSLPPPEAVHNFPHTRVTGHTRLDIGEEYKEVETRRLVTERIDHFGLVESTTPNIAAISAQDVVKFGSVTGFTAGKLSHINSVVNIPDDPGVLLEDCVVGALSGPSAVFSKPGDCGAWVLSREDAVLAGLLWAGQLDASWSYVTPISKVLDDMALRIGCAIEVDGCEVAGNNSWPWHIPLPPMREPRGLRERKNLNT